MAESRQPEPTDDEDIDALTTAVLTASRVLVAVAARSLAAAEGAVTLPQFRLLVVLASRGPLKLTAVADHLAVNPSTALRMIERLTNAGMVSSAPNPTARRERIVDLTAQGRQVVDAVTARRHEEIAAVVRQMPADQRTWLVAALRAFADAGEEPPASGAAALGWT